MKMTVTAGNVLLKKLPYAPQVEGGMEAPTLKVKPYEKVQVVAVGASDGIFEMDPLIQVGAKFISPSVAKVTIDTTEGSFIVVHHRTLRVKIDE